VKKSGATERCATHAFASPSACCFDSQALQMASTQGEQQRLPFFVYGTLCTGFLNWERFIKVLTWRSF